MRLRWWLGAVLGIAFFATLLFFSSDVQNQASALHAYAIQIQIHSLCGHRNNLSTDPQPICKLSFVSDLHGYQQAQPSNASEFIVCTVPFSCSELTERSCVKWNDSLLEPNCQYLNLPVAPSISFSNPGLVLSVRNLAHLNRSLKWTETELTSLQFRNHLDASRKDDDGSCDYLDQKKCIQSCDYPAEFSYQNCYLGKFVESTFEEFTFNYTLAVDSAKLPRPRSRIPSLSTLFTICVVILSAPLAMFMWELVAGVRFSRENIKKNIHYAMFGGGLVLYMSVFLVSILCIISGIGLPIGKHMLNLSKLWLCPYGKQVVVQEFPSGHWRRFHCIVSLGLWYIICVPILGCLHLAFLFAHSISLISRSMHLEKFSIFMDVILNPFTRSVIVETIAENNPENNNASIAGSPGYSPLENEEKDIGIQESSPIRNRRPQSHVSMREI